MRKLILWGLVFMLALSVLGCAVTDDIIADDQGNPDEDEDVTTMQVSDTVKVYLVNIEDSFDPFLTDMDGLLERQAEYQAPYHLKFAGDVIHIIEEQFIP